MRLDAIVDFQMDDLESRAYKLSLYWLDLRRQFFPDYQHGKVRQGDPRKSMVFKCCYKAVRELDGLLPESEYRLYVRAQLDILRAINIGKEKPLIEPTCLAGERAWKRWKLWKKKYDTLTKKVVGAPAGPTDEKVLDALARTQEFLRDKDIPASIVSRDFYRWVNLGKVTPYFLALSGVVKKLVPAEELAKLNFDVGVYTPCLTDVVRQKFQEMFPDEQNTDL